MPGTRVSAAPVNIADPARDGHVVWMGSTAGEPMAIQAMFCGYYGVFGMLMVAFSAIAIAALRGSWTDRAYVSAVGLAAIVAVAAVAPILFPYVQLQRASGFHRDLSAASRYSADWRAYFASSAMAHRWMLPLLGHWREVLFPGFVALAGGAAGLFVGWRRPGRQRETTILYGSLRCWHSGHRLGRRRGSTRRCTASSPRSR